MLVLKHTLTAPVPCRGCLNERGDVMIYHVEFLSDTDRLRGKNPVEMPDIRTLSFTGGRILVSDKYDHITVLSPSDIDYIKIYPVNQN